MSGISEPLYDLQRAIEQEIEDRIDRTITRVEDAILASLKAMWNENKPDLDHADTDEGWHNYGSAVGARNAVVAMARDFDLLDDLIEHDPNVRRYT